MSKLQATITGTALAVMASITIHVPLAAIGIPLLSLFLALTACVYMGALLAQKQRASVALVEVAVGTSVFVCAILGLTDSGLWLAGGYAAHGFWDWAHERGVVTTIVASWFPPACAAFDFVIAGFILFFVI